MGQFFGYEAVTSLYRYSTTQVRLPGGFSLKVGGQGYSSASEITCDTAVSGKGGIDTGSVAAGKVYYVYAVYSAGTFGLVASLSSTSPTGFTTYKKVGVFSTNSISQINTVVYDYNALNSESVLNTKNYLRNNTLLSSSDFPDTTGLYIWPLNGSGAFSGANSYGGDDLTQAGSLSTAANHLGSTVYNTFNGSTTATYVNTSNFTDTGSFTIGGWVKQTSTTGTQNIFDNSSSFYAYILSGTINFNVYYAVASNVMLTVPMPSDGIYHHIVCVYNQTTTSLMIVIDGKIAGYKVDSNLSVRYNGGGSNKLSFGAIWNGSITNPLIGSEADVFYKKSALTFDQVRQLYVAGTKLQAYQDLASKVRINGEIGPYGWQEFTGLNISTTSGAYTAATTQYLPLVGTYDFKARLLQAANYLAATGLGGTVRITLGGTVLDNKATYWYDPASGAALNYIQTTMSLFVDKYPVNSTSSALVLDGNSSSGSLVHWNSGASLRWELWNY